ncbi:flagellar assembly protein FliH [Bacillus ectoiniformans]|uniref:flagellar assembly protein FliH n=1 Tax=Bacillus ectoiniformans TaxID=1494429 RepID=UPI00195DD2B5|nr:flagellar assembly protein FliH [Bacillus ectoiniformans]MBM7647132.1 flagellar assembly protein FliH [Bacillus ectoiniformans]
MSRIIKSKWADEQNETARLINIRMIQPTADIAEEEESISYPSPSSWEEERERIITEAEMKSQAILQEAEDHRQIAQAEIANARHEWEEEKARLKEQAFQEGFAEGQEEGRQAGYAEYQELIAVAVQTVDSSKVEFEKNVKKAEKTILDLALKSAGRILNEQLDKDESQFLPVVQRALKDLRDQKEIQIHIHPSKYSFVQSQKDELEAIFPADVLCYIYPNEELSENGCFIETNHGRIEVGIDSQLEQMRKKLFELLEGEED